MSYKTPGVYVEEISKLPPSVAQVETAIPVFIGYTETAEDLDGNSLSGIPMRIESMLEYETYFGDSKSQSFTVTLDDNAPYLPQSVDFDGGKTTFLMHPALEMFFANGGGTCYIVSVGDYKGNTIGDNNYDDFETGLKKIKKVDEVTLIVIPEAEQLGATDQYNLYAEVMAQCGKLKDRFGIFDVRENDNDGSQLRNDIGTGFLSYGAAYYPHLNTSINYSYIPETVKFTHGATDAFDQLKLGDVQTLSSALQFQKQLDDAKTRVDNAVSDASSATKSDLIKLFEASLSNAKKAVTMGENALALVEDDGYSNADLSTAQTELDDVNSFNVGSHNKSEIKDELTNNIKSVMTDAKSAMDDIISKLSEAGETGIDPSKNSNILKYFTSQFLNKLEDLLGEQRITLPPSSTMAGVYAKVDADRGVWKSPANVSLNRVSGPSVKITHSENDDLNVDTTGKSINAIRAFTGRGTMVWGARTLDGNSKEWKYISVRRFFNMVEESVKKASENFVFEPNSAGTWVKVKSMIENFLTIQWRAGALMGAKADDAFYVKVGLGETMTQQQINDGKMIVEIGLAAVRPAEFIILRFTHKMLQS